MKKNPDDRRNNVERIQRNINSTLHNMELADELLAEVTDEDLKQEIIAKNNRRDDALAGMRHEIKDEAAHSKATKKR